MSRGAGRRPAVFVDGLRLGLGTLTVFPVAPPRIVDRRTGSWAMTWAPLVGLMLGLVAAVLEALLLLRPAPPLLVAALTIGLLAVLTRAIHLDGLADTADGLGSGRPAEQALDVMRRSDIGPFGVVTLVLVLLVQVSALGALVDDGRGPFAIVLALVLSRLALPLVCLQRIPAARPDGLGHTVAASVSPARLMLAAALGCLAVLGFLAVALGLGTMSRDPADLVVSAVLAAVLALAAGAAMCWWCVRRLGGVTGDVLGACVEVTFTVALVVLTLA